MCECSVLETCNFTDGVCKNFINADGEIEIHCTGDCYVERMFALFFWGTAFGYFRSDSSD